jgi:hypothetical protein
MSKPPKTEGRPTSGVELWFEPLPEQVDLDPYNNQSQGKEKPKGRSLDDMRRLNEEMKREHEELVKRLRRRPTRGMRLRFADRELLVDKRRSSLTIGRDDGNDIVVARKRVSRRHARIEVSHNKFVLTDQSANGTFVQSDGEESFIRRGSLRLKGQGMIGLGSRPKQGAPHTIRFTSEEV